MCANAKFQQQKQFRQLQYVRNSVLIISHIIFRDCRVYILYHNLFRNSGIHSYFNFSATAKNMLYKKLSFYKDIWTCVHIQDFF